MSAGARVVIKVGGEILGADRREEARAIAADVRSLVDRGEEVVIVHGGGPQTTALQKRLGDEPRIVGGRRVTDDAALEAIEMVVGGRLNIELCALLRREAVRGVGLHGASAGAISAVKRPPKPVSGSGGEAIDFGHVGDVTGVNEALIALLLGAGYVPVLACIGCDEEGRVYNINADTVASAVAVALRARALVLVTNTPGVLRDVKDPSSRIPSLTVGDARAAISSGAATGGMIPKLEESFDALSSGVGAVLVVGRLGSGDLVRAIEQPGTVGTALLP